MFFKSEDKEQPIVVAAIGDYGMNTEPEMLVADMVKRWKPDVVISLGDNNYPHGAPDTIDRNIGQYYQQFIHPYRGAYGPGARDKINRFFPVLGNHDWHGIVSTGDVLSGAYLDYFRDVIPPKGAARGSNQRYYDFARGPIHFFALDSQPYREIRAIRGEPDGCEWFGPDGKTPGKQAQWLIDAFARSRTPWKIIFFHHAPYSSSMFRNEWMRWPFASLRDKNGLGATAVLNGHNHVYERWDVDGIIRITNGLGGNIHVYSLKPPDDDRCRAHFNHSWGALKISADVSRISFEFYDIHGNVQDSVSRNSDDV